MKDLYSAQHTPLPITSYGKVSEANEGVLDERSRQTMALFEAELQKKVPQEALRNSGTIQKKTVLKLWRPNNYRRILKIQKRDFRTIARIQQDYSVVDVCKHTKLVTIKDYDHLTLQVGRETVTAIWKQRVVGGHKETWCVEFDESESLKRWIAQQVEQIRSVCDAALEDFVLRTNVGVVGELPEWSHFEDWCKEPGLAKVPRDVIVYDSFFKKVYDEGVEFTPSKRGEIPGERLGLYLGNRAFEDKESRVLAELERLRRDHLREMKELRKEIAAAGLQVLKHTEPQQKKLSRWFS